MSDGIRDSENNMAEIDKKFNEEFEDLLWWCTENELLIIKAELENNKKLVEKLKKQKEVYFFYGIDKSKKIIKMSKMDWYPILLKAVYERKIDSVNYKPNITTGIAKILYDYISESKNV